MQPFLSGDTTLFVLLTTVIFFFLLAAGVDVPSQDYLGDGIAHFTADHPALLKQSICVQTQDADDSRALSSSNANTQRNVMAADVPTPSPMAMIDGGRSSDQKRTRPAVELRFWCFWHG
ncbi:hypothetical protein QBC46DRAFT_382599 [Diplogelasinospora grovesii]|uniref:Uncharacterized protein n=1 Tax=Diplogelasinospora grovesii TaxID=303347 RepID=A0AAN6N8Z0_9PEZI|nr:hypothetical protein QBC46DRAFT_382599 [Diplogelasinospora grovesii]